MLRACLGLYPDAPRKMLKIVNPRLPAFLTELTLSGLRVGKTRVSLHFTRNGEGTSAAVREMDGERLGVRIEVGAES